MSVMEVEVMSCLKALPLPGPVLPLGGLGIVPYVKVRMLEKVCISYMRGFLLKQTYVAFIKAIHFKLFCVYSGVRVAIMHLCVNWFDLFFV